MATARHFKIFGRLWPRRFGLQLALIYAGLISLPLIAFSFHAANEEAERIAELLRGHMLALAENIGNASAQYILVRDYTSIEGILLGATRFPEIQSIQLMDVRGRVLGDVVRDDDGNTRVRYDGGEVQIPVMSKSVTITNEDHMVIWRPVELAESIGWVRIEHSLAPIEAARVEIWRDNLLDGTLVVILTFLTMLLLLRRPMKSLLRYTEFASQLNERSGAQVGVDMHSTEFRRLGVALNRASYRLEKQDRAIEKMVADIKRVAAMAENSPNIVFSLDGEGKVVYANRHAQHVAAQLSLPERELATLLPSSLGEIRRFSSVVGTSGQGYESTRQGRTFLWSFLVYQEQQLIHCYAIDITQRKAAEEALRTSESHYKTLFNATHDAIFLIEKGVFIECNDIALILFRCHREALINHSPSCIMPTHYLQDTDVMTSMNEYIEEALKGHASMVECRITRPDGTAFAAEANLTRVDLEGRAIVLAVVRDISERKKAQEALIRQANFDALTELPNRMLAFDRMTQAITRAHRQGHLVGVMNVDLDRFKTVNESFGHGVGDELLKEVSGRLLSAVRKGDTVARLGGDEFCIVLDDIENVEDSERVAEELLRVLAEPFETFGHEFFLGASIGISLYPTDSEDPHVLMRNADSAMSKAKEFGRNNYVFFAQEFNDKAKLRVKMEASLRRAIDNDELYLDYQPQIDARTEKIVGAEALIRWRHPDLGSVSPAQFVPLAEDTGLIIEIGEWVAYTACRDMAQWLAVAPSPLKVSINVSSRQFAYNGLIPMLRRGLLDSKLPPQLLEVEITESSLVADSPSLMAMIKELKEMGVALALDDFGTGYSSLNYLKRFPFDTLKIDRAFVRDITTDPEDAALCEAIIAIAKTLNMKVIGEGAETIEQIQFLRSRGVDAIQGYYYSKPLGVREFEAFLRNNQSADVDVRQRQG